MKRREFIKTTAMAGAGVALYGAFGSRKAWAQFNQSPNLKLWQTSLRGYPASSLLSDIGAAASDGAAPVTGVTHYTLDISQFTDTLHPSLGPTTLWGFKPANYLGGGPATQRHLSGIIVAERNIPLQVTFRNNLPPDHPIPIDTTVPGDWSGAAGGTKNRIAVHLHGSHVPWISDGGPFDWWRPDGDHGLSFLNNVLNPGAALNEAEYYYSNDQPARLLWYHDHAFGMDRNSAYAGVASAYVIRDTPGFEGTFLRNAGMPDFIENGGREIPLVFQDKTFCGDNILLRDPTWPGPRNAGDLWYAHVYDTALFGKLGPNPLGPPPDPSCVPEFFGDTMLVNGTTYPEVTVEARRYRLRILNACNSRFMNLQLYVDDGSPNGITLNNMGNPLNLPALNGAAPNQTGRPTANFLVIGSEGGFLPNAAWVPTNMPFGGPALGSLFLAPAERADVIFDFSAHAGQSLILYNDAPAPFPGGGPENDYFPGLNNKNPVNGTTPAGFGPNTRVLMRFNVVGATSKDAPFSIRRNMDLRAGNDELLTAVGKTAIPAGYTPRQLTLNEAFDGYGRLTQKLGRNVLQGDGSFGEGYSEAGSGEVVLNGSTEVWQIANLSEDTHPIHFHLVNVQVISRQPFAANKYTGMPTYTGPAVPPAPYEAGWKETVRMNPGEVTTVIMKFTLPTIQNVGQPPESPRIKSMGIGGGNEYVWHCHILEHEEHDMMRPLVVI
jgi:FtsP/CotA-like multicopper oxidase with cupredoxin domain